MEDKNLFFFFNVLRLKSKMSLKSQIFPCVQASKIMEHKIKSDIVLKISIKMCHILKYYSNSKMVRREKKKKTIFFFFFLEKFLIH